VRENTKEKDAADEIKIRNQQLVVMSYDSAVLERRNYPVSWRDFF